MTENLVQYMFLIKFLNIIQSLRDTDVYLAPQPHLKDTPVYPVPKGLDQHN